MSVRKSILATALLLLGVSLNSLAASSGEPHKITPTPKGEACVEPTDVMRKNHMEFLLHQRDKTMHEGIRTKQYSLAECINCHATPGEDGKIARVGSPEHFCAGCHTFVGVKLDCFECHADRPVSSFSALDHQDLPSLINPLDQANQQAHTTITSKPFAAAHRLESLIPNE